MEQLIDTLNGWIWSPALIYLCLGAGLFYSLITRFMQVRHFKEMIRLLFTRRDSAEGISSFQALAVALAGRVGMGNIAGVAAAIAGMANSAPCEATFTIEPEPCATIAGRIARQARKTPFRFTARIRSQSASLVSCTLLAVGGSIPAVLQSTSMPPIASRAASAIRAQWAATVRST